MKNPEYLDEAKDYLDRAQHNMCYAIAALEKTGHNFDGTVKQIKETIGDFQCAIFELEAAGAT